MSDDANIQPDHDPSEARDLVNHMGEEARVLIQARRLPLTTLTEEQVSEVRKDYRAYVDKHSISDAQVAKELDLSPSVISQFRNGVYQGDNDKVSRMLNDWTERHARKMRTKLPKSFVTTTVAKEIQTIVGWACNDGSMAAIVAPAGTGKTMVLKYLAEKYRGHYLYSTEDMRAGQFLKEVASLVGVTSINTKTKQALMSAIVSRLAGTNRPLFLDEAHRLPAEAIPRIRTMNDLTGCPIIMAGTADILVSINDRSDGRGQFSGRCLQYNLLDHCLNVEDPSGNKAGRPLFSREEVRAFLESMEVKLDRDGFELVYAVACLPNYSCFRTVHRIVRMLRPEASQRTKPITRPEVKRAIGLLFGPALGQLIGRSAEKQIEAAKQLVA